MNPGVNNNQNNGRLPNHQSALILGIVSIVLSFCCSIFALIPGIIGLVQANGAKKLYEEEPGGYSASSYSQIKTSRILNIIGIVLGILFTIYTAYTWNETWPQIMEAIEDAKNQ